MEEESKMFYKIEIFRINMQSVKIYEYKRTTSLYERERQSDKPRF